LFIKTAHLLIANYIKHGMQTVMQPVAETFLTCPSVPFQHRLFARLLPAVLGVLPGAPARLKPQKRLRCSSPGDGQQGTARSQQTHHVIWNQTFGEVVKRHATQRHNLPDENGK